MTGIKLSEKYKKEREEICNKILDIIGTEFTLYDLDNNIEKQQQILSLKDDIQKYFAVSCIAAYKPSLDGNVKRNYLIIVKFIIKQFGYEIKSSSYLKNERNGHYKRTTKYKIIKPEIFNV
jgi:hypothetical protein